MLRRVTESSWSERRNHPMMKPCKSTLMHTMPTTWWNLFWWLWSRDNRSKACRRWQCLRYRKNQPLNERYNRAQSKWDMQRPIQRLCSKGKRLRTHRGERVIVLPSILSSRDTWRWRWNLRTAEPRRRKHFGCQWWCGTSAEHDRSPRRWPSNPDRLFHQWYDPTDTKLDHQTSCETNRNLHQLRILSYDS